MLCADSLADAGKSLFTLRRKFSLTACVGTATTFAYCKERRATSSSRSTALDKHALPSRRNSPRNSDSFRAHLTASLAGPNRSTFTVRPREYKSSTLERTRFSESRASIASVSLSSRIPYVVVAILCSHSTDMTYSASSFRCRRRRSRRRISSTCSIPASPK